MLTAIQRAELSLNGLSVGDAFGEQFFIDPDIAEETIANRSLPAAPWVYTDDTEMALSVVRVLRQFEKIEQNELAANFALHYEQHRGYGPNMHSLLARFRDGERWREASSSLFGGQGPHGNGAAMRAAPIGAYFAGNVEKVVEQARLSAEVTHSHHDAVSGAIAVAVAAAYAWSLSSEKSLPNEREFLDSVLPYLPNGDVAERIRHARNLPLGSSVRLAVAALGNGIKLSAVDTVPLALWCAGRNLGNYEEALWLTVSALGDRDTTCAIVGGIVALSAVSNSIPTDWLASREALPGWTA